jgi:hypothetical protein
MFLRREAWEKVSRSHSRLSEPAPMGVCSGNDEAAGREPYGLETQPDATR